MKKILQRHEAYVFMIILVFSALITAINPNFFTLENMFDLLKSTAFSGILAIGVLLVLISGGIDISFAAVATISEYVSITLCLKYGGSMPLAFVVAVGVALILGSFNGLLIHKFAIPPIITTIATMNLYYGLLIVVTKGRWIYALPPCFNTFAGIRFLTLTTDSGITYGLSVVTVIWFVLMALTAWMLKFTRLGRSVYAMGGDATSAARVGINVLFTQVFVYGFMGLMAAFAGIVQALLVQTVAPNSIVGKELNVIAAVVLGGASLSGGKGTVLGTFLGVMLLAIVQNGMTLMRVSAVWYDVMVGLVILVSVGFSSYREKTHGNVRRIDVLEDVALSEGARV